MKIQLIASGDLRLTANQVCWPAQEDLEKKLGAAIEKLGYQIGRAHPYKTEEKHGFISSQREGMDIFRGIDPDAPLIVAEAVWQYSHHVLAGLITHRGSILTVANWSGEWPGLVGMLNLNGSLTKAGVDYSTLWSENFDDEFFIEKLQTWLNSGKIIHDLSHARPMEIPSGEASDLGAKLGRELLQNKAIMGIFDEGCMGMFNAIIPDNLLHACGIFKERLSQSSLYFETTQISDAEAQEVRMWLDDEGMTFHTGTDHASELTDAQILTQCKMYIAALRIANDFGCDTIGIQYQQGLKDLLPASDLVEGMLNNENRPPVKSRDGVRVLFENRVLPHFNEVDECAGLDALMTNRVHLSLGEEPETTLHDIRWGEEFEGQYVWVFLISGAAPPAHFTDGWKSAHGYRQPAMYFPSGGSSLHGISKPGEIIWSRIYIENEALHMDLGRGAAVDLPAAETRRRLEKTTPQWPIMHAVTYGVSRDQLMAKHQANHIQVAYAKSAEAANRCLFAKAAFARELGININFCGTLEQS